MEKGDNIRSKEMVEEKRKMKLYLERKKVGRKRRVLGEIRIVMEISLV